MMNHNGPNAAQDFLRRFVIVTLLLVPLFVFSMIGQNIFKYPGFVLRPYLEFTISTFIFGFGLVFFQHALHEIKSRQFGMMTLVSLAVGSGYLFSAASTFIPALQTEFYMEISSLIWVLLLGHYLEAKSGAAAGNALDEVAKLLPKLAHLITGNQVRDVEINELKAGDTVLIKPGEKVPADGIITKGSSHFNEAHISGESVPLEKHIGDPVVAGAIVEDGSVEVRLDKVGLNSTIGQIQQLITNAKSTKPAVQKLADQAAGWLTLAAVSIAILTLIIWLFVIGQTLVFSLTLAITVLVIACPHALGLAIPTVTTIATKKAVNNGIFIKDMSKLEVIKNTDYVIFDKTGTLTMGVFGVSQVDSLSDIDSGKLLSLAASLEQNSSHVIGISIVNYAKSRQVKLENVDNFKNLAGKGVSGDISGKTYWLGNKALMIDRNLINSTNDTKIKTFSDQSQTLVFIADSQNILGIITLADQIKNTSVEAVQNLHALGVKVAMITGDNEAVAKTVAKELNIDMYFANVLPADKYTYVKKLQTEGNIVLMVGDGVNDAPALTQANAGVAIGSGTDVAVEAGDIVLTRSNPADIPALIVLSRQVYRKMVQNLWWALGYNVIAIPAAAGLFTPLGIRLSPQMGAIAMALSSVVVVLNALTLRRTSLKTPK
jgi:Cu2+-exporting ATPase